MITLLRKKSTLSEYTPLLRSGSLQIFIVIPNMILSTYMIVIYMMLLLCCICMYGEITVTIFSPAGSVSTFVDGGHDVFLLRIPNSHIIS